MEIPRAAEVYTRHVSALPFAVRLELLALIAAGLASQARGLGEPPRHSIQELQGLGAEIWEGIDAQEYVNALREGRPLPGEQRESTP
jgi:hypothetical protein